MRQERTVTELAPLSQRWLEAPAAVAHTLVLSRLVTHSFIVILALAAALASSVSVAATSRNSLGGRGFVAMWTLPDSGTAPLDALQDNLRTPSLARTRTEAVPSSVEKGTLVSTSASSTTTTAAAVAPPRREIREHEIVSGDTLIAIAVLYDVSVETLLWANDLRATTLLKLGDKLKIPPVDGLLYRVKDGDSLSWVASHHNVPVETITGYTENDLADANKLTVGKLLMIPGAARPAPVAAQVVQAFIRAADPAPAPAPARVINPNSGLVWPTYGPIFTYFGGYHAGIDISPPYGTPVVAAAAGVVSAVNWWNYSYGFHITIDHGSGVSTLYAHMSQILVGAGESLAQGQMIGRVGSTGRSTGPHLHFEVLQNDSPVNPLNVLPR